MATNRRVTGESQVGNSFEGLLKTDNIFLFVPNII
ncbi:unnamed protein product, partial [Adineta steineri]